MMKKFLKSLSLVMALVMCFTMVFTAAVSADEATPTITFGVKDSVEPGAVSITVDAANFADVAGVQGEITVAGLDDAAVVAGTIKNVVIDAGVISFAEEGEANDEGTKITMADGTLFTITGTAVEGTPITLAWTADETKACDTAEVLIETLSYADKTVEVKKAVVGPTLDENITIDASILVDSTLGVMYVLDGLDAYADWDIVVTKEGYSTYDYNVETTTETITKAQMDFYKGAYYAYAYGFALTDLCLDVTAVVNCYDAEGNKVKYSIANETTIKDLAVDLFDSTSDLNTKVVLTDLLILGDEAQAYFAGQYTSSALAAVAKENYPSYGFDKSYATAEVGELTKGQGQLVDNGANVVPYASILLSPALGYIITTDETPANINVNISYYDAYLKKDMSVPSAEGSIELYKGSYYYDYYNLPLYASNAVVTADIKDGDTVLASYSYTVEEYVSENINNKTMGAILTAIAKFGASARTYFKIA